MDKYCLPDIYNHRLNNSFFDDTPYKDEYQNEVYSEAKRLTVQMEYKTILDIGTGSGFKLIKFFKEYDTTGIEIEPTLSWLKNKYPDRIWKSPDELQGEYDVVICSDVIEHIQYPDKFLEKINQLSFKVAVFSTPDRSTMYSGQNFGPPLNPAHIREWNMDEFFCFVGKYFRIINQLKYLPNTQVIVCTKI